MRPLWGVSDRFDRFQIVPGSETAHPHEQSAAYANLMHFSRTAVGPELHGIKLKAGLKVYGEPRVG